MSSGLRIVSPSDPDYDPKGTYPDHLYLYTGGVDSFKYAATRPQQWKPNTVGRYRNTDPVLINYLNRLGIEKLKLDYLSYPQRNLWDKIGVRTMVMWSTVMMLKFPVAVTKMSALSITSSIVTTWKPSIAACSAQIGSISVMTTRQPWPFSDCAQPFPTSP